MRTVYRGLGVMRFKLLALLAATLACAVGGPLQAANLLVNGDFDSLNMTNGNALHSTIIGNGLPKLDTNGDPIANSTLPTATGWTTTGYNFVMINNPTYLGTPNSQTGADDAFDAAYVDAQAHSGFSLWGPDSFTDPELSGYALTNGLTNSIVTPTGGGGNFIAADGAFQNRPLEQIVSGLTIGQTYHLSFEWAAAQQRGFSGATTEGWTVCFGTCTYIPPPGDEGSTVYTNLPGDQIFSTGTVNNVSHGFVPWQFENFTFTATSTTETLSLLAFGTPNGQPPFALLDNVQLSVPEPTTWAMMLIGFGVIGGVMRTRRRPLNGRRALGAQII